MVKPLTCPCPCHKPGKTPVTSGHVVDRIGGALICIPCPECELPLPPAKVA